MVLVENSCLCTLTTGRDLWRLKGHKLHLTRSGAFIKVHLGHVQTPSSPTSSSTISSLPHFLVILVASAAAASAAAASVAASLAAASLAEASPAAA